MPPEHVLVLGGGITGLTSAFHLSRRFPNTLVTLLEKSPTLGGWIRSERVTIAPHASVLLEAGPRTLQPGRKALMELINLLGLTPAILTTSKNSPAAKRRYLHLPPNEGLVAVPTSIWGFLVSPLNYLILPFLLEALRPPNRPSVSKSNREAPQHIEDESVDSFLSRRFGPGIARVFGSSLIHGIYASDSRGTSMRAAFGKVWKAEERGGSVVRSLLREALFGDGKGGFEDEYELGAVEERLKGVSVFSFRDGIATLPRVMEDWLNQRQNVRVRTAVGAHSLDFDPSANSFEVKTSTNETLTASHVVSALPLPTLSSILPPLRQLPHLTASPSSSVTVINLVFPGSLIHPKGFGYLIPRPVDGYSAEESEGILGCVFDSCAIIGQDVGPPVTKLTVMIGGPYKNVVLSLPSVLRRLEHHLAFSTTLTEPLFYKIHEHKECIPVPGVGHLERVAEVREVLRGEGWGSGRMEVVGAGVDGVSVSDCIEAGRRVGSDWS